MARNAFRVALRLDTPVPGVASRANVTQELDPSDILEVQDMAEAIARAELLVAAPRGSRPGDDGRRAADSSSADMFESLGRRAEEPTYTPPQQVAEATRATRATRATDDAIGPATPAPPPGIPTPVPPRFVMMPQALPLPSLAPSAADDDAYFHPAGRIRSLADATLDGYRPEPTLLVRAAGRRKRFSWVLLAALVPLLVLAFVAVFAGIEASSEASSSAGRVAGSVPATGRTPLTTTSAASKAATTRTTRTTAAGATPTGAPVFNVNSLPAARPRR